VLKKIKKIKSRDQILIAVYRYKKLLAFKKRINAARISRALNRPAYLKTQANIFKTQSVSSIDRISKKDYKKDFYYNYNEHGHIAKFCTTAKKKTKK
jgi:hypothetical protein